MGRRKSLILPNVPGARTFARLGQTLVWSRRRINGLPLAGAVISSRLPVVGVTKPIRHRAREAGNFDPSEVELLGVFSTNSRRIFGQRSATRWRPGSSPITWQASRTRPSCLLCRSSRSAGNGNADGSRKEGPGARELRLDVRRIGAQRWQGTRRASLLAGQQPPRCFRAYQSRRTLRARHHKKKKPRRCAGAIYRACRRTRTCSSDRRERCGRGL